jgi:hypothetical protein
MGKDYDYGHADGYDEGRETGFEIGWKEGYKACLEELKCAWEKEVLPPLKERCEIKND